jgi:hypothetical protein
MPSLSSVPSVDIFYGCPEKGVVLSAISSPVPDDTYGYYIETAAALNRPDLNVSLTYGERFAWLEQPQYTMAQANVVLNPFLQYADAGNIPLNQMPPHWRLVDSSQTNGSRWRFYPYSINPSGATQRLPHEQIYRPAPSGAYTVFFPNGYAFLYPADHPIPTTSVNTMKCIIAGECGNVQLNKPYVLEIYYLHDVWPRFSTTGPSPYSYAPSGQENNWRSLSYVRVRVFGVDSGGVTTETALQADLKNVPASSVPGVTRMVFHEYEGSGYGHAGGVMRWLVSSNIVFSNSSTQKAEIEIGLYGAPGLAVVAVLMYPLESLMVFNKDVMSFHRTQQLFNPGIDFLSRYGGDTGNGTASLEHGVQAPLFGVADKSGYSSNEPVPVPSESVVPISECLSGELVMYVRKALGRPPSVRVSGSYRPPEEWSYVPGDSYFKPSNYGVLSYPYTGGYTNRPLNIARGQVLKTYSAPSSKPYATFVEFLSSDIPVRPNIRYGLHLTSTIDRLTGIWPNPSYNSAPYARYSTMCYQVAVYGYDKDNNLVETAFLSLLDRSAGGYNIVVPAATMDSLESYVAPDNRGYRVYPSISQPFGYIIFQNSSVVKARIAAIVCQPYVRVSDTNIWGGWPPSGDDTTPYLMLPHPSHDKLRIQNWGLFELWPEPFAAGSADFIPSGMADFTSFGWTASGLVSISTTGSEAPGSSGYAQITSGFAGGSIYCSLPWSQSSERQLWFCVRLRLHTTATYNGEPHFGAFRFTLIWKRSSRTVRGTVFYIHPKASQMTSLGGGWYEVESPVFTNVTPFGITGPDYPDTLDIEIFMSLVQPGTVKVGYVNIGFKDDARFHSTRKERVLVGVGPSVSLDLTNRSPRVVGISRVSKHHWALKVRPGIAYVDYTIPSYESSHSWLIEAGFNPGDRLMLVYTLPEYSRLILNGVPTLYARERVFVKNGVFRVSRPVNSRMDIVLTLDNGTSISGNGSGSVFHAGMFEQEVTIRQPSLSGYTGEAEVYYPYYTTEYLYTGCWHGSKRCYLNLSVHSTSTASAPFVYGYLFFPDPPDGSTQPPSGHANRLGFYICLRPSMAIPYTDYQNGVRTGVVLPANGNPETANYLYHLMGVYYPPRMANFIFYDPTPSSPNPRQIASMVLAWVAFMKPLGYAYVDFLDVRNRGGGLPEGYQPANETLWDVGSWDGDSSRSAGRAIVRLPASLLQPAPDRDAFTHEQILEIVGRYLPAGIDYEVEYV